MKLNVPYYYIMSEYMLIGVCTALIISNLTMHVFSDIKMLI